MQDDKTNKSLDLKEISSQTEHFHKVIDSTLSELKQLLLVKGKEYIRNNDVYHNFNVGAKKKGITPEKALDGMLLKHEISIEDMTNDLDIGVLPTEDKVNEKFNDNLVYLLIKKAMILNRIRKTYDQEA